MKQSLLSSLGPIAILSLSLWACDEPADPHGADAKKDRGAVAVTASATATAEAPKPKLPPVLTAKAIDTEESGLSLYTIANGLAVSDGLRVGWLSEGKITWAEKQIPPKLPNVGDNRIQRVYGEWPDRIDVVYTNMNGRVMAPTYFPLTGEGHVRVFAEGGGLASIYGVARVGERTLIDGHDMMVGNVILAVRGEPAGLAHISPAEAKCKEGEISNLLPQAGVSSRGLAATRDGTLVAVGHRCSRDRDIVAEIWQGDAKRPKLVELKRWWRSLAYNPKLLVGTGDTLYIDSGEPFQPLVEVRAGDVRALPRLLRHSRAFVGVDGTLYAHDGQTVFRFAERDWVPVAHLTQAPSEYAELAHAEGHFWLEQGGKIHRLEEGEGRAHQSGCDTPFVFLYEVSYKAGADYQFPTTTKALAKFADAKDVELVDFKIGSSRYLGVKVESEAQGEALAAHVEANMKDEHPQLVCHDPGEVRVIPIPTTP